MNCYGYYDKDSSQCKYSCRDGGSCERKSNKNIGGNDMHNDESKEVREKRLDEEWEKTLPCHNCSDKMVRLCKYYNTFKRPNYPSNIFKIGTITCDDQDFIPKHPNLFTNMHPNERGLSSSQMPYVHDTQFTIPEMDLPLPIVRELCEEVDNIGGSSNTSPSSEQYGNIF